MASPLDLLGMECRLLKLCIPQHGWQHVNPIQYTFTTKTDLFGVEWPDFIGNYLIRNHFSWTIVSSENNFLVLSVKDGLE